jgi:hypothetical protein
VRFARAIHLRFAVSVPQADLAQLTSLRRAAEYLVQQGADPAVERQATVPAKEEPCS